MVADLNAAVVMQIEKEIKDAQKTIHSAYVLFYKLSRVMENATDRLNGTLGEFEMSLREVRQNVSLARNEFVNMLKEVLLAFNVIIWLVAIYILIRIISAARRSNSKKSRRIEHHSSLPDTKYRQRKKRPNFLTKMIPFSSERRNSATQVVNITTPEQKMPLIEQNNGEGKGSAIMGKMHTIRIKEERSNNVDPAKNIAYTNDFDPPNKPLLNPLYNGSEG